MSMHLHWRFLVSLDSEQGDGHQPSDDHRQKQIPLFHIIISLIQKSILDHQQRYPNIIRGNLKRPCI